MRLTVSCRKTIQISCKRLITPTDKLAALTKKVHENLDLQDIKIIHLQKQGTVSKQGTNIPSSLEESRLLRYFNNAGIGPETNELQKINFNKNKWEI